MVFLPLVCTSKVHKCEENLAVTTCMQLQSLCFSWVCNQQLTCLLLRSIFYSFACQCLPFFISMEWTTTRLAALTHDNLQKLNNEGQRRDYLSWRYMIRGSLSVHCSSVHFLLHKIPQGHEDFGESVSISRVVVFWRYILFTFLYESISVW